MKLRKLILLLSALSAAHCGGVGAVEAGPRYTPEAAVPGVGIVKELQELVDAKNGLKAHQEICTPTIFGSIVRVDMAAGVLALPVAKDWTIQCDEETFARTTLVDAISPSLRLRVSLPLRPMIKGLSEKQEVEHWATDAQEAARPAMDKLGIKVTQSSVEALGTSPPGWVASAVYGEEIAGKVSVFPQTGFWGLFGELKGQRVLIHVTSYDVDAEGLKARRRNGQKIVGAAHISFAHSIRVE